MSVAVDIKGNLIIATLLFLCVIFLYNGNLEIVSATYLTSKSGVSSNAAIATDCHRSVVCTSVTRVHPAAVAERVGTGVVPSNIGLNRNPCSHRQRFSAATWRIDSKSDFAFCQISLVLGGHVSDFVS